MLLKYKFLIVDEPGLIIFHLKEKRVYFSAGPAAGA
jgi:hypothetical protein